MAAANCAEDLVQLNPVDNPLPVYDLMIGGFAVAKLGYAPIFVHERTADQRLTYYLN